MLSDEEDDKDADNDDDEKGEESSEDNEDEESEDKSEDTADETKDTESSEDVDNEEDKTDATSNSEEPSEEDRNSGGEEEGSNEGSGLPEEHRDDQQESEETESRSGREASEEVADDEPVSDMEGDETDNPETPEDDTDSSDDTEVADDIIDDDDAPEDATTIDGDDDEQDNGGIFNDLEKEKDVQQAIETIRQRVADAEENFIKRNAEDKEKINELIGKISDNVKTVNQLSDDDSTAGQEKKSIAEESARIARRQIKDITESRPQSVMERMIRNLTSTITKDQVLRESYTEEDGSIDMASIVEAGKVMYGFLETLNTLQLVKVTPDYIKDIVDNM